MRFSFTAFSTQFEGRVRFMYLDVKALVTIGIGNLIDPIDRALPLPFVFKTDETKRASADDITADWNAVKSDPGLAVKGYKACDPLTSLKLLDPDIDALVMSKADDFVNTMKQTAEFSTYDDWPADAQLALLSMAWAMGPAFGPAWPSFRAAVADENWGAAAANCHMNEAGNPGLAPRNVADRALFQCAAHTAANSVDPSLLQYTVVGSRSVLRESASGDDVSFLQGRLEALRYLSGVSGTFDDATQQAVVVFQTDNQLPPDGVVGPSTWAALGTIVPAGMSVASP